MKKHPIALTIAVIVVLSGSGLAFASTNNVPEKSLKSQTTSVSEQAAVPSETATTPVKTDPLTETNTSVAPTNSDTSVSKDTALSTQRLTAPQTQALTGTEETPVLEPITLTGYTTHQNGNNVYCDVSYSDGSSDSYLWKVYLSTGQDSSGTLSGFGYVSTCNDSILGKVKA